MYKSRNNRKYAQKVHNIISYDVYGRPIFGSTEIPLKTDLKLKIEKEIDKGDIAYGSSSDEDADDKKKGNILRHSPIHYPAAESLSKSEEAFVKKALAEALFATKGSGVTPSEIFEYAGKVADVIRDLKVVQRIELLKNAISYLKGSIIKMYHKTESVPGHKKEPAEGEQQTGERELRREIKELQDQLAKVRNQAEKEWGRREKDIRLQQEGEWKRREAELVQGYNRAQRQVEDQIRDKYEMEYKRRKTKVDQSGKPE